MCPSLAWLRQGLHPRVPVILGSREDVLAKLEEELDELKQALADRESLDRVREELGDVLFSAVNLARFVDADAESLLRAASEKFTRRFCRVESLAAQQHRALPECSLEQLEAWWQQAKRQLD